MVYVVLGIVGLCLGSFVNALVWRLHEQAELGLPVAKGQSSGGRHQTTELKAADDRLTTDDLSVMRGRSMCPHCHHELAAKDLVPVLSWLTLRGRCRYCGAAISWQYPVVELLMAILFIVSYLWWPYQLQDAWGYLLFGSWALALVLFVALAVYDLRWYLLPNRMVFPLVAVAIVYAAVRIADHVTVPIVAAFVLSTVVLFGIFYALFTLSDGKWIGGGDVKLAIALGLFAGSPLQALLVIFFASILGLLGSLPGMLRGRLGVASRVPFGPFLLAATMVVVLFGPSLIDWYSGLLRL